MLKRTHSTRNEPKVVQDPYNVSGDKHTFEDRN